MARVKRGVTKTKRHKKVLKQAKGYYGNKSRTFRGANEQVMRSGNYAFRDRRAKKGDGANHADGDGGAKEVTTRTALQPRQGRRGGNSNRQRWWRDPRKGCEINRDKNQAEDTRNNQVILRHRKFAASVGWVKRSSLILLDRTQEIQRDRRSFVRLLVRNHVAALFQDA